MHIAPHIEKRFIFDSYACRKTKGVHKGVKRLRYYFKKSSKNYTQKVYFLKCDIKKFFDSIERKRLFSLLKKRIKKIKEFSPSQKEELLFVIKKILYSDKKTHGIPIGNLTSQLFANVYLDIFDHFIKEKIRAQYYIRYMDDFIIISRNRTFLENLIPLIEQFLEKKLALTLHPEKRNIYSSESGIDFLGYFLKKKYTLLRFSTKKRMLRELSLK